MATLNNRDISFAHRNNTPKRPTQKLKCLQLNVQHSRVATANLSQILLQNKKWNPKAVRWKDRQDVYILTNTHAPPVEGNFTQESGQAIKPRAVEDYNAYMRFVDKSDRIVNSYGIARRTWQWTKELFFHLTDMTILNAFLIHKSCSGKMKHKNFCEILFRELIIHSQ